MPSNVSKKVVILINYGVIAQKNIIRFAFDRFIVILSLSLTTQSNIVLSLNKFDEKFNRRCMLVQLNKNIV